MQRHSRTTILLHVVWATRYRAPSFESGDDSWLAAVVHARARLHSVDAPAVGNAADHVHVLLRVLPTVRLATIVQSIKGGSARAWNLRCDRDRLAWQDGYWIESFGPAALAGLVRYVARQREHHARSTSREAWESFDPEPSAPHG